MSMLDSMRMPSYRASVNADLAKERERNSKLQSRAAQLEKQIKVLIDDSVALLKARMTELGINATSPGDLLTKAKEIVLRHKQLQAKASKLQAQVSSMETEQTRLTAMRHQELNEKFSGQGNGLPPPPQPLTQDYILKEISATLSQRKKLHNQVSKLEHELNVLERSTSDKQAAASAQQQRDAVVGKHSQNNHHHQQQNGKPSGTSRKNREGRSRSQEWPDVPDIGKIQENNPEILAQKILETGRQIEAGRIPNRQGSAGSSSNNSRPRLPQATFNFSAAPSGPPNSQAQGGGTANRETGNRVQEPPRVANFEDRLKSIITSVLNEDQQNRSKQQQQQQQQQQHHQMQQQQQQIPMSAQQGQSSEPDRKRQAIPPNVTTPDYTQVFDVGIE